MPLICLQAGHINAKNNCNVKLQGSTGAPGEQEFTARIQKRLAEILQLRGFQVKQVDAIFNCSAENDQDFSLFLAIHYDANIYGKGGGFLDVPEPSTDGAAAESKRIVEAIESEYFKHSEIVNMPQRRNANTRYYYMWQALSFKTPCVLIECGVGKDAHDSVLLADTDRICNAIARGICKAFNVQFDLPSPAPAPPTSPVPEPIPEPQPVPEPTPTDYKLLVEMSKTIIYGKGWPWTKIKRLKELLPQ